jgi:curved DNA-binding protein CbpA
LEALKAKFRVLSTETHPDRFHNENDSEKQAVNQRYLELNAAYNCLRQPQERLQHLLELELGAKPDDLQQLPNGAMDLFAEVGQLCRNVDAFLHERAEITSPFFRSMSSALTANNLLSSGGASSKRIFCARSPGLTCNSA